MRPAFFFTATAMAVALASAPARAADLPILATQAVDPTLADSGWKGWTFGVGVSAVAIKGARGQFGGDTFLAYDHVFANDVALSLQFDTGYAPNLTPWTGAKGFNFATLSAVTVFNASSNVRPFITTQASVARGLSTFWNGNPLNVYDSLNGAFSGPGSAQAVGAVGAGVAVDLTPNVTVVMGVQGGNGIGLAPALMPGF